MGYDDWLEKPYQDWYAAGQEYSDWCESQELDPEDPDSAAAYERALDDRSYDNTFDTREEYERDREERGFYDY